MKHARKDYAPIQDPRGEIPEDEPVFLLRGQDIIAPYVIRKWADKVSRHGGDPRVVNSAYEIAAEMEQYQRDLKSGPKVPDLPPALPDESVGTPVPPAPKPVERPSGATAVPSDPQTAGSTAQKSALAPDAIKAKIAAANVKKEGEKADSDPEQKMMPKGAVSHSPPKQSQTDDEVASDIKRMKPKVK